MLGDYPAKFDPAASDLSPLNQIKHFFLNLDKVSACVAFTTPPDLLSDAGSEAVRSSA